MTIRSYVLHANQRSPFYSQVNSVMSLKHQKANKYIASSCILDTPAKHHLSKFCQALSRSASSNMGRTYSLSRLYLFKLYHTTLSISCWILTLSSNFQTLAHKKAKRCMFSLGYKVCGLGLDRLGARNLDR